MDYCMAAFVSTHAAMTARRALAGRVPHHTMPTLRVVSVSCGLSLRMAPGDVPAARAILVDTLPADAFTLYAVEDTTPPRATPL